MRLLDLDEPPVSLALSHGEALALVGPSGSGRTWLLRVAAGLRRPRAGTVRRHTRRLGYVFQDGGLVNNLSVRDNLALPLLFSGVDDAEAGRRTAGALDRMGLDEVAELRPAALAPETRRVVQVARVLALEAELVFLEEPFVGLPSAIAQLVTETLVYGLRTGRLAVLLSATEVDSAARIGASVVRLDEEIGS